MNEVGDGLLDEDVWPPAVVAVELVPPDTPRVPPTAMSPFSCADRENVAAINAAESKNFFMILAFQFNSSFFLTEPPTKIANILELQFLI